jgi:diketogulonate reductase-like aldo/keto reductase
MMTRRAFAWTGIEVPVIGHGTWNLEGSREQDRRAIEAVRAGLELGMTHIDTAEMYGSGRSEQLVGEAIAGRRKEVFLVTKVLPSNASYKGTLAACERSLERLQTEWIDLYLLHWPGREPIQETMQAMEELVARRKVRFIGVSNFDVPELRQAQAALTRERLACNQVLYYLGERGIERKLIPYCKSQKIAVVAYSPFGQERFPSPRSAGGRVLVEIGKRHQRTARQVALNFLTRDADVFTIPKSGNAEHVRENSGGAGWNLDTRDIAEIDRAFPAPDRDVPLGML